MATPKQPKWKNVVIILATAFYGSIAIFAFSLVSTAIKAMFYSPEQLRMDIETSNSSVSTFVLLWVSILLFVVIVLSIRNLYRMAILHDKNNE